MLCYIYVCIYVYYLMYFSKECEKNLKRMVKSSVCNYDFFESVHHLFAIMSSFKVMQL